MFNIFVQTLGYIGVLSFVWANSQKTRKNVLIFSFLGRVMFITHYCLIGGFAGAIQNTTGGVAATLSGLKGKKPYDSIFIPIIIVVTTAVGGVLTYDKTMGWQSLLPAIAMLLQNPALWLKRERNIRLMSLAGIPLWFCYNYLAGSVPAMVCDTFSISALLYALTRYDIIPAIKAKKAKNEKAR